MVFGPSGNAIVNRLSSNDLTQRSHVDSRWIPARERRVAVWRAICFTCQTSSPVHSQPCAFGM